MKNKTLLNSKLSSYTALACALLATREGDSQVVYTDVDPDIVIASGDLVGFDLDNDGTDDFGLTNVIYSGIGAMNIINYTSDGIAGYIGSLFGSTFPFVSVINAGQTIGPALDWYSTEGNAPLLWGSFAVIYSLGEWDNVSDKFVGLRMKIGADFHYGWARLDVSHTTITLKDYAYNETANAAINTTVAIETANTNFNPKVFATENGVYVALPDNIENANVSVFDLSGRMIHSEFIFSQANILLKDIPEGMYLVKVASEELYFAKVVPIK